MYPMENLVEEFELSCRAAGLSEKTINWYVSGLEKYRTFVEKSDEDWRTVRSLRRYFAALRTQKPYSDHPGRPTEERILSVSTILAYGRAVNRFFNWLVEEGYLANSPMTPVHLPRRPKHVPKDISRQDIQALINVATSSRDRAIILFLATTGVRSSELRNLRLSDLDMEQHMALVRGKGDKERYVFFDNRTAVAILEWLEEQPKTNDDFLFTTLRGSHLTEAGLRQILRRLREKAEITNPVSPHRFRHAFAKNWMMNGGDEFSLAKLMGHEDIATTRIYSQFRTSELKEKYARIMSGH